MYNKRSKIKVKTKDELKDIIANSPLDADLNHLDVSLITDMDFLFRDSDFQGNISEWDVSNLESAYKMFINCPSFNSDLSKWKMPKLTDASYMFSRCPSFNSDLSKWKMPKLTDASYMFSRCPSFNSDLSKWDVSNVDSVESMFYMCESFNSDVSSWDISSVSYKTNMFADGFFKGVVTFEEYCAKQSEYKKLGLLAKLLDL